jgi:hypothetical protein
MAQGERMPANDDRHGLEPATSEPAELRPALPYHSVVQTIAPPRAAASEMLARGSILAAFRQATLQLWGEAALSAVALSLPDDVREQTVERTVSEAGWYPERFVIGWYEALWRGPCDAARDKFVEVLNRMMDFGFGRLQKARIALERPSAVLIRAGELWRQDHSHGDLTVETGEGAARMRLANHPYAENPLSCLAIAEVYRYCVALCRAKGVLETHYRDATGALIVRIRWDT